MLAKAYLLCYNYIIKKENIMEKMAIEQMNWRELPNLKPIFKALDEAKENHLSVIDEMPANISFCLGRLGYEFKEVKHFEQYRSVYLYYDGSDGTYTIVVYYMKLCVEIWFDPKK